MRLIPASHRRAAYSSPHPKQNQALREMEQSEEAPRPVAAMSPILDNFPTEASLAFPCYPRWDWSAPAAKGL
jgi:hypothetical protein